jgi:hypothetical protein
LIHFGQNNQAVAFKTAEPKNINSKYATFCCRWQQATVNLQSHISAEDLTEELSHAAQNFSAAASPGNCDSH